MKNRYKIILLGLASVILIMFSLCIGTSILSPLRVIDSIIGSGESIDHQIILSLRIPRILMAVIIGASLSVSGVLFQAILKNPLSDPYTIGVSGGAALGATLAIINSMASFYITLFAFVGSTAVILILYTISRKRQFGSSSLILSGIALSFILQSVVFLVFAISKPEQVHKALLWLMGDISISRFNMLWQMGIFSLILIAVALFFCKHLDIISFGKDFARNLGVEDRDVRNIFIVASLLTALSVSLAGVIGFVGLIIPHIMRYIFGPNHLRLIPSSAIGGALFIVMSDAIGRSIAPPYEIPVGIITGFFGGIFFLLLLLQGGGVRE